MLAPEHPLVDLLTTDEQRDQVAAYKRQAANQDLVSRKVSKEKTGVFTGSFALNPATQKPIPIWIADYVLMEYGTGAIMAVPGHDERDFEFAKAFDLAIVRVVAPAGGSRQRAAARPVHRNGQRSSRELGAVQRHSTSPRERSRSSSGCRRTDTRAAS